MYSIKVNYEEINIKQTIYLTQSRKECEYGHIDFTGHISGIRREDKIYG